jgi:hypothetical protein
MNVTAAASANQITPIQATVANEACTCCAASYPVSVYLFLTTNIKTASHILHQFLQLLPKRRSITTHLLRRTH